MVSKASLRQMITRFSAEFADSAAERTFRRSAFRHTRVLNRVVAVIVAALFIAFGVFDYIVLGASPHFFTLLAMRTVLVAIAVAVFTATRKPEQYRRADYVVLALQFMIIAVFMVVTGTRTTDGMLYPPTVTSYAIVMIVLGNYVFVATRLLLCTSASVLATISYLVVSMAYRPASGWDFMLEGILLASANVLGFVMLHRVQVLQRRQHALLAEERLAGERLQIQSRELRAIAHDLAHTRDEATIANRAKSEFLAHMSHELRSPLNAIIGFTEVMTNRMFGEVRPARYREYVEDIHASGNHLLAVINDLLDLSKAESGRVELHESAIDAREAALAAVRLIRERARSASVTLETDMSDELPHLFADERMLKQIILNLLTNAVKFTRPGGSVKVSARLLDSGDLRLAIADTGIGIDAADIPKVLEAYGQADVARTRSGEGTGLGLPLVKSMAEAHGATVRIDSEIDRGTTVAVDFPAERVAQGDPAEDRIAG